jgi:hypothetical protein
LVTTLGLLPAKIGRQHHAALGGLSRAAGPLPRAHAVNSQDLTWKPAVRVLMLPTSHLQQETLMCTTLSSGPYGAQIQSAQHQFLGRIPWPSSMLLTSCPLVQNIFHRTCAPPSNPGDFFVSHGSFPLSCYVPRVSLSGSCWSSVGALSRSYARILHVSKSYLCIPTVYLKHTVAELHTPVLSVPVLQAN